MPPISIIIPTYNEAYFIPKLLPHLWAMDTENLIEEIIVVDAGSTDETRGLAASLGARVLNAPVKGRAQQMNFGAQNSRGKVLHFIHADAFPPKGFSSKVMLHLGMAEAGCFRSLFNTKSRFLRFNSYFTRFSGTVFRGGGQTLFITRALFERLGGYCEQMRLMEEYDLIIRIKKHSKFIVIQQSVLVSDRDYEKHGNVLLQVKYACIFLLFFSGASHDTICKARRFLLHSSSKK